jgi:ABC-type branched-subunit amino acid transport system substrate-binding protein
MSLSDIYLEGEPVERQHDGGVMNDDDSIYSGHSRRGFLRQGIGAAGALLLPGAFASRAFALDHPPIGTYPAGSEGGSVYIGIAVPRTGTYAVQGEDELKGYQLAVEHINSGHELIRKISPKTKKGVLGKEVKYGVADSAAKPNDAVQAQQRFITENKAVLMTGSTSSAVAVALNKLAQREKVLYVAGISGSNDTTGKDCVRYGFRQCFYGQTAAAAIGPIVVKTFGKNKKAAYLTPDYTYGHTVTKSMQDYLATAGWTTATNQVAPLGAPDYSSYLLNVANSGADVLLNVNWGHDAVLSLQQAKQFGIFDRMKLVIPYQTPFLARETGGDLLAGVYAATDFWWTLQDKYPLAKMFVEAFEKKYGYKPEWGANNAYMEFALWAEAVENAGSFYPPDVIKSYEAGRKIQSTVGEVYFRKEDHQLVRPVIVVRGKAPKDMKNKEDFYEVVEVVPGAPLMQKPDAFGCNLGPYT